MCDRNFGFPRRETGGTQSLAKYPGKDKELFSKQLIPVLSCCAQVFSKEKRYLSLSGILLMGKKFLSPAMASQIPDSPCCPPAVTLQDESAFLSPALSLQGLKEWHKKNLGSINQEIGNGHMATFLDPEISPFIIKQEPP